MEIQAGGMIILLDGKSAYVAHDRKPTWKSEHFCARLMFLPINVNKCTEEMPRFYFTNKQQTLNNPVMKGMWRVEGGVQSVHTSL